MIQNNNSGLVPVQGVPPSTIEPMEQSGPLAQFADLPVTVVAHVLKYLPLADLRRFMRVSHSCYQLVQNESLQEHTFASDNGSLAMPAFYQKDRFVRLVSPWLSRMNPDAVVALNAQRERSDFPLLLNYTIASTLNSLSELTLHSVYETEHVTESYSAGLNHSHDGQWILAYQRRHAAYNSLVFFDLGWPYRPCPVSIFHCRSRIESTHFSHDGSVLTAQMSNQLFHWFEKNNQGEWALYETLRIPLSHADVTVLLNPNRVICKLPIEDTHNTLDAGLSLPQDANNNWQKQNLPIYFITAASLHVSPDGHYIVTRVPKVDCEPDHPVMEMELWKHTSDGYVRFDGYTAQSSIEVVKFVENNTLLLQTSSSVLLLHISDAGILNESSSFHIPRCNRLYDYCRVTMNPAKAGFFLHDDSEWTTRFVFFKSDGVVVQGAPVPSLPIRNLMDVNYWINPAGDHLVINDDKELCVLSENNCKEWQVSFRLNTMDSYTTSFSPNQQHLVIREWEYNELSPMPRSYDVHVLTFARQRCQWLYSQRIESNSPITCTSFSKNSCLLATASEAHDVHLYGWSAGHEWVLKSAMKFNYRIFDVSFVRDNMHLCVTTADHCLHYLEIGCKKDPQPQIWSYCLQLR
ncbi:F-box protein [Parendozoicomonas haliclonae]